MKIMKVVALIASYFIVFFGGFIAAIEIGSKVREKSYMDIETAKVVAPLQEGYEMLDSLDDQEDFNSVERRLVTCYVLNRWHDAWVLEQEYDGKEYLISDEEGKQTLDHLKYFVQEMSNSIPTNHTPKEYRQNVCGRRY